MGCFFIVALFNSGSVLVEDQAPATHGLKFGFLQRQKKIYNVQFFSNLGRIIKIESGVFFYSSSFQFRFGAGQRPGTGDSREAAVTVSGGTTITPGFGLKISGPGLKDGKTEGWSFEQTSSAKALVIPGQFGPEFHGLDIGAGIKVLLGVEVKLKIGFYDK